MADGKIEMAKLADLPGHGILFLTTAELLLHVQHLRAGVSITNDNLKALNQVISASAHL